ICWKLILAELGDSLLVEDPRHGVDALDPAAIREHLHRAEIEQPHRARARRRVPGRLHQRRAVAVAPGEQPHALVERELLADLEVSGSEAERSLPCMGCGLRVAE